VVEQLIYLDLLNTGAFTKASLLVLAAKPLPPWSSPPSAS
jgi:hypothetical protein